MKLSVSAFRAQASAQRKILSSYQNQLNYGACTSFPALGGYALEGKSQMMVDSTAIASSEASHPDGRTRCSDRSEPPHKESEAEKMEKEREPGDALPRPPKGEQIAPQDRSPGRTRSKSNQRWMKLRTTVQLSGAISSTNQKSKAPLKREDSFLKRFSTRQIPETQETVDTGDETETHNGSQTQTEVNRRRRKRRKEMSKTVVNPDENFYFYWLMTVTVCVLYNLWTLIVRQSFPELQKAASAFWYSGDGFTDIVFVCDIMVQLRTGYLEQGLMVYNSKKLASHYLKSRAFILDTLSLLPLDFLQLNIGVNPLLRFPRFLKVYRVYNYYYMVESRTVYPNLWRVVNLIHILLILAHWFGCFYYLLSEAEGFQGDWVYPHRPGDYATLTRKYLGSLYWSTLTLTTIGDLPTPETNAESRGRSKAMTSSGQSEVIPRRGHKSRLLQFNSNYGYLFTIVSYLIGVFIFATIVGQVGNVITNRNANRLEFERLLDGAKTYMRHHKVPGGMKRRVLRWYDYSWSRGRIQGGGDINTALGLLPDKLKTELALHVNLSVLKKVTIFQECQPEFLHDLVLKMKAYIFTPGDLICRKGEVAREMFIIADGILDVISETGRVLTTMKAGDFFGEIGILNLDGLNKRTADVRSVGYSELFSLSREDVLTAMKDYPEAQDILKSLGRKRLMEAKNASKMHKAQVRQAKDHDSSGDSDTAGKRIVEKLRSDVKGLKKALRRSRRGTKGAVDGAPEFSGKKQNLLRRMSHVQSSDECETAVEAEQTPIGAGLPLLQRLKILKEKQEREREEKESLKKLCVSDGSPAKKGESSSPEKAGSGLPFGQKLKLLKQKELKETTTSGFEAVPSTVRTQVTGSQSSAKTRTLTPSRNSGETTEKKANGEKAPAEPREKIGAEMPKIPLKERLKLIHVGQPKERVLSPKNVQEEEATRNPVSKSGFETDIKTSINVPTAREADNLVPKLVRNSLEVPVSKDGWKLLKKSSISCAKSERELNESEEKIVRKVSKAGTYLSKSDTVLERQSTVQRDEEKRSRSISPSQKRTEEDPTEERRRSRSAGRSPGPGEGEDDFARLSMSTVDSSSEEAPKSPRDHSETTPKKMKKYNSISDLSPEYSGLPFVKKLKILNERQKLEELEKELLVRSASLDVSERPKKKQGNVLVRSQSEASATEYRESYRPTKRNRLHSECRNLIDDEKRWVSSNSRCSEGSIASPESNETLERRRLKSILKKLSAEGSTSDEDKASKAFQKRSSPSAGQDSSEFKKLMREPTMEGYVARHKKLTKSVTFDSDTLPSPLDAVPEQPPDDSKARGCTPMSPTAILTLQLSNLSMMPIASPKKTNKTEGRVEGETQGTMARLQEGDDLLQPQSTCKRSLPMLPSVQALIEKKVAMLPFAKNQHENFFKEIEGEILEIVRQVLEKAHNRFESRFSALREEVKKRDEIIAHLQSNIRDMERKYFESLQNKGNAESSATDSDFSDVPFQREDSCETVWDIRSPCSGEVFDPFVPPGGCSEEPVDPWKTSEDGFQPPLRVSESHFDEETRSDWESVSDARDNVCLVPTHAETAGFMKRGLRKWLEPTSEEEMELSELGKSFRARDSKRQRRNGSAGEGHGGVTQKRAVESGAKTGFMSRVSRFQRSISCQEKNSEFVALDIDDSSNSSDVEHYHNKDWEVEMLVEELAKKDPYWKVEEANGGSRPEGGHLEQSEDVQKLREDVNALKRVVCDSDLSRLTSSELDILESIIEAKDQKILQMAKSNSLENGTKSEEWNTSKREASTGPSEPENKEKESQQTRKFSLKHKIGLALSFDFHDIEGRKPKIFKNQKHVRSYLKTQKTFSGSHREHQSLYNLWRTSARLRNRVLDDSDRIAQNLTIGGSASPGSRSSLPILMSTSPDRDETSFRTSLPLLSAEDFRTDFGERLRTTSAPPRPPTGPLEEPLRDSDRRDPEAPPESETPASDGSHAANSLNSFIRSVGQKVKQVMAGDANTVRNQVPTISRLLEEQSSGKGPRGALPEEVGDAGGGPSQEDPEAPGPFDRDPNADALGL